jgi:hypothetical protein
VGGGKVDAWTPWLRGRVSPVCSLSDNRSRKGHKSAGDLERERENCGDERRINVLTARTRWGGEVYSGNGLILQIDNSIEKGHMPLFTDDA